MTKAHKCRVYTVSGLMIFVIFIVNIYFLHVISSEPQDVARRGSTQDYSNVSHKSYTEVNKNFVFVFEQLRKQLKRRSHGVEYSHLWSVTKKWNSNGAIYVPTDSNLANILQALKTAPITYAENSQRGTQFKLSLTLQGNQTVLFKPQWYSRSHVIRNGVYSGKDRHTAEVAAFHLSLLLDIRWVPLAVVRRIHVKRDVWDLAPPSTRKTMFLQDGTNAMCMYGKCFYCRRNESVCSDSEGYVEGAVILMVGGRLNKYRSPWQRTYAQDKMAEWEYNEHYCSQVKKHLPMSRLLDLVDGSILDYLLQNGDRHHYETLGERVVFLDNGKGLGNPFKDYQDILAPLYQCCIIRTSTWDRLKLISGGSLSSSLQSFTSDEVGAPIFTQDHLIALERRLLTIYSTVDTCVAKYGKTIFKNK